MKKLLLIAAAAFCFNAVSAQQYLSTDKGHKYTYSSMAVNDKDTIRNECTVTVKEVVTDADGKITTTYEKVSPVPGNSIAKVTEEQTYFFTPANGITTVVVSDAEGTKKEMVETIKAQAESAGHIPTESELAELEGMLRVKGELSLALDPKAVVDTKLPNKTLRVNMGPQTFTFNLWEGKVKGTESVTTSAGSFECYKVTYTMKINMGAESQKFFVTDWYAPGIGLVKSVNADKKGNIIAQEELIEK